MTSTLAAVMNDGQVYMSKVYEAETMPTGCITTGQEAVCNDAPINMSSALVSTLQSHTLSHLRPLSPGVALGKACGENGTLDKHSGMSFSDKKCPAIDSASNPK